MGQNNFYPGTYEARGEGGLRVNEQGCYLALNWHDENGTSVKLIYGEPFTFRFFEYHGRVQLQSSSCRYTALFRIGD